MYYHTKITVSVLSDTPLEDMSLAELNYLITDGDASGQVNQGESKPISREELQTLCDEHGTDISFFIMDEDDE